MLEVLAPSPSDIASPIALLNDQKFNPSTDYKPGSRSAQYYLNIGFRFIITKPYYICYSKHLFLLF